MASGDKDFSAVQDQWSEWLISEEKFCDAVAVLGPAGRKVQFIRAHLAALSEPLCAALYEEFKESSTREITLKDISVEAFDVMQRSSHHLDPKLTPERAVATLQAAKLYLIDGLSSFCLRYLNNLGDPGLQLQAMTAALKMSYSLPKDLTSKFCKDILLDIKNAVGTPDFLQAHGSIIYALIQSDALEIDEEVLFAQLLKWAASAVRMPELLGPFADACSQCVKRPRAELEQTDGPGSNELAQQNGIVQMIAKHMRFDAISKEFFFDKVRPWLTRECSDTIIGHWLLGRQLPEWCLPKRPGMSRWAPLDLDIKVEQVPPMAPGQSQKVQDLLTGSVWKPSAHDMSLKLKGPSLSRKSGLKEQRKVVLNFSPEGLLWSCELQRLPAYVYLRYPPVSKETRSLVFEGPFSQYFQIIPSSEALHEDAAQLTNITMFTRTCRMDEASKEAVNLSSKIMENNLSE